MTRCFDRPWHPSNFCSECGSPITEDEEWECLVCVEKTQDQEDRFYEMCVQDGTRATPRTEDNN